MAPEPTRVNLSRQRQRPDQFVYAVYGVTEDADDSTLLSEQFLRAASTIRVRSNAYLQMVSDDLLAHLQVDELWCESDSEGDDD